MIHALPPPIVAEVAQLPPLRFLGFRAGMALAEVHSLVRGSGGRLGCRATSDPRMRECNGSFDLGEGPVRLHVSVLVSAVHDSAAVIVLSTHPSESALEGWVAGLTADLGTPNVRHGPGMEASWEWIRQSRKLVISERKENDRLTGSVTFTDGPLLDGLGPPKRKGPD